MTCLQVIRSFTLFFIHKRHFNVLINYIHNYITQFDWPNLASSNKRWHINHLNVCPQLPAFVQLMYSVPAWFKHILISCNSEEEGPQCDVYLIRLTFFVINQLTLYLWIHACFAQMTCRKILKLIEKMFGTENCERQLDFLNLTNQSNSTNVELNELEKWLQKYLGWLHINKKKTSHKQKLINQVNERIN
jgi:hypothetical protein